MAYALIPDGYTLKKVTKLEKQALDEKRTHDDAVALLNNPNTPLVVGAGVAGFFLVNFADEIVKKIKAAGVTITEEVEEVINDVIDEQKKKLIPDISLSSLEASLRGSLGRLA
jgi:hypothetical protein